MKRKLLVFGFAGVISIFGLSGAKGEMQDQTHQKDVNPLGVVNIETQEWYVAEDRAKAREYISPRNSRAEQLSIADIIIPPGVEVIEHHHIMEEVYLVMSGQGMMKIKGVEQRMKKGDAVVILPNERHSIRNDSETEPLRLIVVCTPPWAPEHLMFDQEK